MQNADEYSWTTFDETISRLIQMVKPRTVLDVGAGAGKYAELVRAIDPTIHITATELGEDSIQRHGLAEKYDVILRETSSSIIERHPVANYDLVIMGDVIEHMRKSEGLDFLNWINYRAKYIAIVVPEAMPMSRDPWYEGHNSVWTDRDFSWHDNWCFSHIEQAQLFLLRGYLQHDLSMAEVCDQLNASDIMLEHFGGKKPMELVHMHSVKSEIRPSPNPGMEITVWWRVQ